MSNGHSPNLLTRTNATILPVALNYGTASQFEDVQTARNKRKNKVTKFIQQFESLQDLTDGEDQQDQREIEKNKRISSNFAKPLPKSNAPIRIYTGRLHCGRCLELSQRTKKFDWNNCVSSSPGFVIEKKTHCSTRQCNVKAMLQNARQPKHGRNPCSARKRTI